MVSELVNGILRRRLYPYCSKLDQHYDNGNGVYLLNKNYTDHYHGQDYNGLYGMYGLCYDGYKWVYIVSDDGFVVRFDLDDKKHETIFAADDGQDFCLVHHIPYYMINTSESTYSMKTTVIEIKGS